MSTKRKAGSIELDVFNARSPVHDADGMREVVSSFKRLVRSYRDTFRNEPDTCNSGDPELEAIYLAIAEVERHGFKFSRDLDGSRRTYNAIEQKRKWADADLDDKCAKKCAEIVEEWAGKKSKEWMVGMVLTARDKECDRLKAEADKLVKQGRNDDAAELNYMAMEYKAINSERKIREKI